MFSWFKRKRRTIGVSQKGKREITDAEELARLDDLKDDAKPIGEFLDDTADLSDEDRELREALAKTRKKRGF